MDTEEQLYLSDLTQLEDITLEKVLACLIHRFERREYCTFAGSVLVSINPCSGPKKGFGLVGAGDGNAEEGGEVARFLQILKNLTGEGLMLEPHVLSFGVKSLYNLSKTRNNQVIVVSGDSGAGKTTCTQELIKFFTFSEGSSSVDGKSVYSLERKIFEATLILEALGNAGTAANPNSSRFGRLVRLYFSKDCKIQGAEIKTYLLEKHRVSKGSCNERNFHVFHYLLQAVKNGYLDGHSENVFGTTYWEDSARSTDLEKFISLSTALTILDLFDEFLYAFEILFAILHLRNVEFVEDGEDDEDKENLAFRQKQYSVSEQSQHHLEAASLILGVNETSLHNSLIFQTFSAGNRRSISMSPCVRKEDCEARLHSLISTIYEKLFHQVVNDLNKMFGKHSSSNNSFSSGSSPVNSLNLSDVETSCISILDLYGFENLEFNHLEQLCINYANERIQQVQVSVLKGYFDEERRLQEICGMEEPKELLRLENEVQARLDVLQQGVFCILDEACLLKRPTPDKAIFQQLVAKHTDDVFVKPGKLHSDECPFVIRHYAADVKYSMAGMITKNKDFIPDEFVSLLGRSSKPFVQNLVPHYFHQMQSSESGTQKKGKPEGRKTILMRFKTSVNELVKELCETFDRDLHFIKCVRPNATLKPGLVDSDVVKKQLYACGIVDIIRIAGNGYPIRMSKKKFLKSFRQLVRYFCRSSDITRLPILFTSSNSNRSMKIGKHHVFLTEKCLDALERVELLLQTKAARNIQSSWRCYKARMEAEAAKVLAATVTPEKSNASDLSVYFTPMTMTLTDTFRHNQNFSTNSSLQPESPNSTRNLLDFSTDLTMGSESFAETVTFDANHTGIFNSTLVETPIIDKDAADGLMTRRLPKYPPSSFVSDQSLYYHNHIVSRAPVHSLTIKVYTKKTALGFIQRPSRLRANGIQDAIEDYGIVLEPCNVPSTSNFC